MKKIIAFGASNSVNSINQILAENISTYFTDFEKEIIKITNYELPFYSIDYEIENGIPENVLKFYNKISEADLLIISLAEHNGSYVAYFKNLIDWTSRFKSKFLENKKVFLLSTSTGARGGLNVLEAAKTRFPFHGAEIVGSFAFPKFNENYNLEEGITNQSIKDEIDLMIKNIRI